MPNKVLIVSLAASMLGPVEGFTGQYLAGQRSSGRPFIRPSTHLHMSVGSASPEDREGGQHDRNRYQPQPPPPDVHGEFEYDLNHQAPSEERRNRMETEREAMSRFAHGDELMESRKRVGELRLDLADARNDGDLSRLSEVKSRIARAERRDAELMYHISTERMRKAEEEGLMEEAENFHQDAMAARSVLPQFNIGGLWVGKYGDHGYEMINVTYVGNTLVAYKVTGDQNVPKGEITFTADLSPNAVTPEGLDPIELSESASQQWGTKHLPRFPGKGQVAAEGFEHSQWMDGQLIIVGDYFSFAWVPLGHQIFFGRPSAELTLKMLKASQINELRAGPGEMNNVAQMRAFAMRCWEETEMLEDDMETEGLENSNKNFYNEDGAFE